MAKKYYILAVGLTIIIGIFVLYQYYFNEEAKVKKKFQLLGERISKKPEESKLIAAASVNKTLSLFAKIIRLEIPSHSISKSYARKDLSAPIFMKRSNYSEIKLRFYDFIIEFPAADIAQVNVTLKLKAKNISGEYIDETHELYCSLKKNENDDWIFNIIEFVEVLEG